MADHDGSTDGIISGCVKDRPVCVLDRGYSVDQLLGSNRISPEAKKVAHDLITDGISIIKNSIPPSLCDQAVNDYNKWLEDNAQLRAENLDSLGREKRLVNFHLASDAAGRIATNERVMRILDEIFGTGAHVYTSLTFKYGTQQPIHRDTPHFATWPARRFVGVWTALEDIEPEAGPLMYVKGAQNFDIDAGAIFSQVQAEFPDETREAQLHMALDRYNGVVIDRSPLEGPMMIVEDLKKGDTVIWHPELPHGGSPATNPARSRMSMVVHCASDEVQVHQHDAFFSSARNGPPTDRYGFIDKEGRKVAYAGDVAFM